MIANPNVKINLGLNVLRKREDGFHDLETLFVPYFGISDTLEIIVGDDYSRTSAALFARYGSQVAPSQGSVRPEGVFGVETEESTAPKLVQGMSEDGRLMITIAREEGVDWDPLKDLTAKAYFILAEDHKLPPVKIFLEKTSPVGAGLGGGSADAAFALKMLNELCELGLDESQLAGYASRLGSDCAFFIYNRPMIGEGRGEILAEYPLDDCFDFTGRDSCISGKDIRYQIQVITPAGISVSTKDAYGGIRPHLPEIPLREALARPVEEWDGVLVNDFEETVFAKFPELAAIKKSLYDSGAVYASMSGSGSALFAIYPVL
ncbi:MAG: 4-(cytidine 5'-diphospho)-2-C-methyl-D-erythritol kinase [Bacteroidales bacterium]|nr:4-(cytidine 5'-diphospho)-2-C-methyl-D-erythritol kinase [Bacteroidales bacterium]MBP3661953.1 4-(cytidine 5'-diphospho)-2-C-methyl-D-erythritol kinase [Bacteroidales bacterium]